MNRRELLETGLGDSRYTNIIFKCNDGEMIRRHLELLDNKLITWDINKIDLSILLSIFSKLSESLKLIIYKNLLTRKLVILFSKLEFSYLLEYLELTNNISILNDLSVVLEHNRYGDLYNYFRTKYELYIKLLASNTNYSLHKYFIQRIPYSFFRTKDLYNHETLLKDIILSNSLIIHKKIILNYPLELLLKKRNDYGDTHTSFILMLLMLPRVEYSVKYLKYFHYFTFSEMKILVPLIYPSYILSLSYCKEMSFSLYLNLVEYMNIDQVRLLLEKCNIELYLDIFGRLTRKQILHGLKNISEERFWVSLKTVSFTDLPYLIEGINISHKDIFINRILELAYIGENLLHMLPQYLVMCFNYRETFEIIIGEWPNLPIYLTSIILKVVNGKKLLIISELCTIEEWGRLCIGMDTYLRDELENEILNLEILESNSIESVNLIYYCKTFCRYNGLQHIFMLLKNNNDRAEE